MTGGAWIALAFLLSAPDTGRLRQSVAVDEARLRDSPDDADALRRLGEAYLQLEEPDRAVPPLRELARRRPGPESTVLLARALRLAGEAESARALLDTAIAASPNQVSLHVERALLARSLDDNDGAIRSWTQVTELQPQDASAYFNLAESLQRSARLDEAIANDRKALEMDPGFTPARINLAKALAEKGLTGEAKELLNAAAAASALGPGHPLQPRGAPAPGGQHPRGHRRLPAHPPARPPLRRGAQQPRGGPRRQGRRGRGAQGVPRRDQGRPALGRGLVQPRASPTSAPGDNQRANEAFARAQKINPTASAPYTQLGQLYLRQGKRTQAVTAFQKAIALMAEDRKAARSTEAYRGLAIAYVGLGRFKEAVAVLEKAVKEFPEDGNARAALADAHLAMGDLDGAIAEAERRLQYSPTPEARLDLAALYARKRVSAKAEPLYQAALQESPDNSAAALGLADLYLAKGDYAAADKMLTQARPAVPTTPRCSPGWASSTRAGAVRTSPCPSWSRWSAAIPTQLEARAELGSLYFRGGDPDMALKTLRSVLATDPRQPLAQLYLGQVLFERGQPAEAEKAFRASLRHRPDVRCSALRARPALRVAGQEEGRAPGVQARGGEAEGPGRRRRRGEAPRVAGAQEATPTPGQRGVVPLALETPVAAQSARPAGGPGRPGATRLEGWVAEIPPAAHRRTPGAVHRKTEASRQPRSPGSSIFRRAWMALGLGRGDGRRMCGRGPRRPAHP